MSEFVYKELKRLKGKAFGPDDRLYEDVGLSSLAFIQLVTDVCSHCGVDLYSLSTRDLLAVKTVADLERLVRAPDEAARIG